MRCGIEMTGILRAFSELFLHRSPLLSTEGEIEGQGQPAGGGPLGTVLAIDDDPAYLSVVGTVLREEGFDVLTATSGSKGLNMLAYAGCDIRVVLLDYNMPNMDGAETLRHLRRLYPLAKVLAVTGVDLNLLPASFHECVDKLIQKPFQTKDLIDAIKSLSAGASADGDSRKESVAICPPS
jgi:CheY-like chemotaxis protein